MHELKVQQQEQVVIILSLADNTLRFLLLRHPLLETNGADPPQHHSPLDPLIVKRKHGQN